MRRKSSLFIVAMLATSAIYAQGLPASTFLQQNQQDEKESRSLVSNRLMIGPNSYAAGSILQVSTDNSIAFYMNVAKQNGWYVGIGPALTKEEASHLNVVYKFSQKNNEGHWMKLEAIDGYGNHTTEHALRPYIVPSNNNDSTINADWKQKLSSICQWELMPDGSGKSVIMERAYDKEKNLIYNYQPVFISNKEIIGSYTDSWGLPAKMSKKNGKSEDVMVNILIDQWGNDSIIKLIDTEGKPLMNSTGSWIVRNICDRHGNVIENYALNQLAAPMNDNWGNCSWKAKRDKYGNTIHISYFDAGDNPVRLSYDYTFDNVFEEHYVYDRWHRIISKSFYNENLPDTTKQGVHRVEYTYNDYGQILSEISKGQNNEPRAYKDAKSAFDYYVYDKKGHRISFLRLGPDSTFLNNDNYYCLMLNEYNGDRIKKEEDYIFNGSDTILWHYKSYSAQTNIYYHRKGVAYVDTLDAYGNILSRTYVSKDQDPINLPNRSPGNYNPFSRYVSTYQYMPHSCTTITTYYDKDGNWTRSNKDYRSPSRTIITADSLKHTITHTTYDKDSIIIAHYQEVFDDYFSEIQYKQSLTTMGDAGRSGMNDDLYYKTKVEYTPTGEVASILSLNEFDEPSYAYSNGKLYCYQIKNSSGSFDYYDENKIIIDNNNSPSSKAACIEIISETGHSNGLRDGDIIIRYGDWFYHSRNDVYYRFDDLYAQMVFSAPNDSIDIWVLRHFPKEKDSKIIKLNVKGGTSSEIGFVVHEIIYTNLEIQRFLRTFMAFKAEEEEKGSFVIPKSRQKTYKHLVDIIVPKYTNRRRSAYSRGWQSPMIFIAAKWDDNTGWPESEKRQIYVMDKEENYLFDWEDGVYLLSEDGRTIRRDIVGDYMFSIVFGEISEEMAINLLAQARAKYPDTFIPNKGDCPSNILRSQPSYNPITAKEMLDSLIQGCINQEPGKTLSALNHVEDIDTMKVFKVRSWNGVAVSTYRNLTYQLDKNHFTTKIVPQDTTQIAQQGIAFIHETANEIDEILYLSKDTIAWVKGHMTHGTNNIIRKNMLGGEHSPFDKYSQDDIDLNNREKAFKIASLWHKYQLYGKSRPLLKKLCKRKYGPAYTTLARTYLNGAGVEVDTTRAISLFENAIRYGEPVHQELGRLHYEFHQYKSAESLLKVNPDIESYILLGSIYEYGGHGLKINLDSALYYYKKAEVCFEDMDGKYDTWERINTPLERVRSQRVYTPNDFKDLAPAIAHTMSAENMFLKGCDYYDAENYLDAYSFFKAAADSLYPKAEVYLAEYMRNEIFGFNDKKKAQEYLQMAIRHYLERAETGDSTAYSNIAYLYMYHDVEGLGLDYEKAKCYFKLALRHKDFSAAETLGDMYLEEYNFSDASQVYLLGAEAGRSDCMIKIAQLFELESNMQEAIYWYRNCYQIEGNEEAKKALLRLGVPLANKLKDADFIGVWLSKGFGVKVFLPKGVFFGMYYKDVKNISKELMEGQFKPWMYGNYYVNGNTQYIENVQKRNTNTYLGIQHLTCQIDNDVMKVSWEGRQYEHWEKLSDSDQLIEYIQKNWDYYKQYILSKLQ